MLRPLPRSPCSELLLGTLRGALCAWVMPQLRSATFPAGGEPAERDQSRTVTLLAQFYVSSRPPCSRLLLAVAAFSTQVAPSELLGRRCRALEGMHLGFLGCLDTICLPCHDVYVLKYSAVVTVGCELVSRLSTRISPAEM